MSRPTSHAAIRPISEGPTATFVATLQGLAGTLSAAIPILTACAPDLAGAVAGAAIRGATGPLGGVPCARVVAVARHQRRRTRLMRAVRSVARLTSDGARLRARSACLCAIAPGANVPLASGDFIARLGLPGPLQARAIRCVAAAARCPPRARARAALRAAGAPRGRGPGAARGVVARRRQRRLGLRAVEILTARTCHIAPRGTHAACCAARRPAPDVPAASVRVVACFLIVRLLGQAIGIRARGAPDVALHGARAAIVGALRPRALVPLAPEDLAAPRDRGRRLLGAVRGVPGRASDGAVLGTCATIHAALRPIPCDPSASGVVEACLIGVRARGLGHTVAFVPCRTLHAAIPGAAAASAGTWRPISNDPLRHTAGPAVPLTRAVAAVGVLGYEILQARHCAQRIGPRSRPASDGRPGVHSPRNVGRLQASRRDISGDLGVWIEQGLDRDLAGEGGSEAGLHVCGIEGRHAALHLLRCHLRAAGVHVAQANLGDDDPILHRVRRRVRGRGAVVEDRDHAFDRHLRLLCDDGSDAGDESSLEVCGQAPRNRGADVQTNHSAHHCLAQERRHRRQRFDPTGVQPLVVASQPHPGMVQGVGVQPRDAALSHTSLAHRSAGGVRKGPPSRDAVLPRFDRRSGTSATQVVLAEVEARVEGVGARRHERHGRGGNGHPAVARIGLATKRNRRNRHARLRRGPRHAEPARDDGTSANGTDLSVLSGDHR
mmetsp:Transcript_160942/g.516548  ORF Transcript_160942/g.516548 Transcript_160942/m.516548 type:complete len:723 (+) Transcript_160942:2340-4508(+)